MQQLLNGWAKNLARKLTGTELAARRRALGLSQGQLAAHLKKDQTTISRWESGERQTSATLNSEIGHLEERLESLVDATVSYVETVAYDVGIENVSILVHQTDESFWRAHPEHEGLPVVLQQVAAAHARLHFERDIPIFPVVAE
jgi:transcriptional regulator with XRE-family HTH domain